MSSTSQNPRASRLTFRVQTLVARILRTTLRVYTTLRHRWLRVHWVHRAASPWLLLVLVPALLAPASAFARGKNKPPPAIVVEEVKYCERLEDEDARSYNVLTEDSMGHYGAGEFAAAIDDILKLKKLCDEDPRLDFNLAKAYQRANNCNMARFWFEHLLDRLGGNSTALAQERPRLAQDALADLSLQCTESARIAFFTDDPELTIELTRLDKANEPVLFTTPFEGRVDAGLYHLVARRKGMLNAEQTLTIAANEENHITLAPLLPTSAVGVLTVRCPVGVQSTTLVSADGHQEPMGCGESRTLADGHYQLRFEVNGYPFREELDISKNRTLDVLLTQPALPNESLRNSDWGLVSLVVGSTLVVAGGGLVGAAELMQGETLEVASTDPRSGEPLGLNTTSREDDRTSSTRLAGYAAGGIGVGLVLTGAVLVLVGDSDPASDEHLTLMPIESGWMAGIRAHF